MARASMQIFWSVMMLLITATVFCVMVLVYQLSSNALYSRAIDAGVTVATVNDLTGSGVQIANANAAAVASISGGREIPQVDLSTTNYSVTQAQPQPQPQPQAQPQSGGFFGWLFTVAVKMAAALVVVFVLLLLVRKVV